jgi:tRNA(Ile)-lysidine synthase
MKGPEDDVTDRVVGIISRYSMFPPCARVGVAVSGGADSVCLLALLRELRGLWNLRLTVLHLNHLLRGSESDADQSYVEALAERWGLPLIVQRTDVAAMAEDAGENLEQAAREARRAFFRSQIAAGNLDRVALGHTRSDQAETVLFRLLRGAYTTGLAGIRPVTQDGIVRPLLDVDRREVEQYLREQGIAWRQDSSNRDLRFARNRIRHELLPSLSAAWNPALPQILAGHAQLALEDEEYWRREVDKVVPELLQSGSADSLIVDVRQLTSLPAALRRRIVRRAIELIRGDLRRIELGHVEAILRLAAAEEGHARTQVPGVDVWRSFDWVRFVKPAQQPIERDFELPLEAPGRVRVPDGNVAVWAEIIERKTIHWY